FRGSTEHFTIPAELAAAVGDLSRRTGATRFMILLATFQALLAKHTGGSDIVVGTTVANRNRAELQPLAGFFAAPLVMRTRLAGELEFGEVLGRVRKSVLETYAHQDLPFAKVVEATHPGRQSTYTPLFRVMFSVVKSLMPDIEAPGLSLEPVDIDSGATDFDIFFNIVEEGDGLRGFVIYSSDLFDQDRVRSLIDAYVGVLSQAINKPDTLVADLVLPRELVERRSTAEAGDQPLVAVSATFTAEPVEEVLHFWWRELDFDYQVRFAPYNQVFQQLLDPAGIVGGNRTGVNVLLLRLEDWARGRSRLDKLEANVGDFVSMLESAASKSPVPYLVCLCPASDEFRADAGR
ncbi:MAG: hypothetical protein GY953_28545, partial [bacterium]|nr:hypothetical protein [bacterium]